MFGRLSRKGLRSFSAGTSSFLFSPSSNVLTHFHFYSKPPFGRKMQQQAISIPQFELNVVSNDETVLTDGVQVELAVELSLKETKPPSMIKKGSMKLWASIASITSDGEFIECVLFPPSPSLFDFLVNLHLLAASAASASTTLSATRSSSTSPSSSSSRLSASSSPFPARLWVRPLTLLFPTLLR